MKDPLIYLLKRIHSRLPLWSANFYLPIITFMRNLQTFFLYFYLIEGEERESGAHLKIAFFSRDSKILNYWTFKLFRENPTINKSSLVPVWKIDNYTDRNTDNIDLVVVEITKLSLPCIDCRKGFILPRWFDTLLNVENTLNTIKKTEIKRQINKYGFTCEEKFATNDLKFFYERMFKPYIQTRHKESSVMANFSYFQKRFRKKDSRLFFLMKDNEPVAALFNERKNGMIKFSGVGVLDAKSEILTMGAIRALYYLTLCKYKEEKIEIINFGGTSPLLSDGLTQFKSLMRALPNKNKLFGEKALWISPLRRNEIHPVLKSNPFIFIAQRRLYRAIFIDSSEYKQKHEFMEMIKKIWYNEIDGTKIFCLHNTDNILQWLNEEALPNHEVINIEQ